MGNQTDDGPHLLKNKKENGIHQMFGYWHSSKYPLLC